MELVLGTIGKRARARGLGRRVHCEAAIGIRNSRAVGTRNTGARIGPPARVASPDMVSSSTFNVNVPRPFKWLVTLPAIVPLGVAA